MAKLQVSASNVSPLPRPDEPALEGIGKIADAREELDEILAGAKQFAVQEPDEVMRSCSAWSARLIEMKIVIGRVEDRLPVWRRFRTKELDEAISMLQEQYKIASRLIEVRRQDWEMSKGF